MLKYSSYRSIYNETSDIKSLEFQTAFGSLAQLKQKTNRLLESVIRLFKRDYFIKLTIVILLVLAGFTVVGNVFAGPVLMKQERRVVVERGDTLWSIALKNKPADMRTVVYIEEIKRSSGLVNSNVMAGDVITLPIY